MKIIWRVQALSDLREALRYLKERDFSAALHTSQSIPQRVGLLADHPQMGRPRRVENTRELVVTGTSYIVAYTIDNLVNAVVILRVLHGRRLWPEELDDGTEQP